MLTKRIWRWELTVQHEVLDQSGWNWFRPVVKLMPFEEMLWQALSANKEVFANTVSGNALLSRLTDKDTDS